MKYLASECPANKSFNQKTFYQKTVDRKTLNRLIFMILPVKIYVLKLDAPKSLISISRLSNSIQLELKIMRGN